MPSAKDKETAEPKRKLQKVLKIRKSTNRVYNDFTFARALRRSQINPFLSRQTKLWRKENLELLWIF